MPRAVVDDSERMNLRVKPEVKARLVRAAALRHEAAEHVTLSERDSLVVLDLLENPPAPNARLRAAIAAMPKPE